MRQYRVNNASVRREFIKFAMAGTMAVSAAAVLRVSPALTQTDAGPKVTQQAMATLLAGWPDKQQEVARHIIEKYGLPDGGTTTRLIMWLNNGPWEYSILYRQEVPHNFPVKHMDMLEQAIHYRVPPEKFNDLATYNGSITVHRTQGEMSAMCDREEMNFLALNLAHDLLVEKLSVEEARQAYSKMALAFMKGDKPPYTQALQFQVSQGETGYPDQTTTRM
jgi:hypothetical protein